MTPLGTPDGRLASSLQHAAAQAEGAAFEELLEWTHKTYLSAGRAALYRNQLAARYIGRDQLVAAEQARPDFSGTLAGGRAVHFDAKTIANSPGWRLPKERDHQYTMLLDQARLGAIAFFIVEDRAAGAAYLLRVHPDIALDETGRPGLRFGNVPVADWRLKEQFRRSNGTRSPREIPALCIPRAPGGTYDWLTAVETFWIGQSSLPPKPTGRPRSEEIRARNVRILQLAKQRSTKQVAEIMGMNIYTVRSVVRAAAHKHKDK